MTYKTIKIFLLIIVLGVIIGFFVIMFFLMLYSHQQGRIIRTTSSLHFARKNIRWFKEKTGKWPFLLSEIGEYVLKNNINYEGEIGMTMFSDELIVIYDSSSYKEHISKYRGNSNKYDSLDGSGGFYYNNQTGEVKVNLTKPVKHYMRFYHGKERDEIPSDW